MIAPMPRSCTKVYQWHKSLFLMVKLGYVRSTKKVSVTVNVNSNALPSNTSLGSELSAGFLTLNSHAEFSGKLVLMLVMKKKKSTEINCTMNIDLSTKEVQAMSC